MAKGKPSISPPKIKPKNRTNKKKNEIYHTLAKSAVLILSVVVGVLISQYLAPYVLDSGDEITLAAAGFTIDSQFTEKNCSQSYLDEVQSRFKDCVPQACGRAVSDSLVTEDEALQILAVAQRGMSYGGGAGGASILDLHSGALSQGEEFVNIYSILRKSDESLLSKEDKDLYMSIMNRIRLKVSNTFKVHYDSLHLTSPTFFSRMVDKPAKTSHDEYWHSHVDKATYPSFHFTSLLYLSTYSQEFTGGRFMFLDKRTESSSSSEELVSYLEPKLGRVSMFSSGAENTHRVEKVSSGTRWALTIAFTCNSSLAVTSLN